MSNAEVRLQQFQLRQQLVCWALEHCLTHDEGDVAVGDLSDLFWAWSTTMLFISLSRIRPQTRQIC